MLKRLRLGPKQPATYSLGAGLQTLGPANPLVGSKSQVIGVKDQGPKRACGCSLAYIKPAGPSSHSKNSCKTMSEEFSAPICAPDGEAQVMYDIEMHTAS